MSSSSVKRVFSSVQAVINLAIREHGLSVTNVFSGTFIPDDEVKKKRLPILLLIWLRYSRSAWQWIMNHVGLLH